MTSIMDLYSRKIIAWVLSDTLEAKWIIEAVTKVQRARKVNTPLILHTDYAEEKTMPKILIDAYKIPISSIFSA